MMENVYLPENEDPILRAWAIHLLGMQYEDLDEETKAFVRKKKLEDDIAQATRDTIK